MTTLAERMTRREAPAPNANNALDAERTNVPPSRRGKRGVLVHVDPECLRRLKYLAADENRTQSALLIEAIDDLFLKYGRT